ncbi:O-antigen ligase family protein [Rhizobiaceae bacterium n13]|uniref:O-antigen ligase family protein n=1 Tax=Ferirhizobium litorale TaxID=2927786 RepID=A0AAE3QCR6_9HYPH|nr:O-antigen ligase family protein [Fererhizobium litorale]MDI7861008.1 O-antigen ligase family protein [Fererhizobium litorale]MDI7921155.1 O-antigen ligase family protein [Fererhizobium litorale]
MSAIDHIGAVAFRPQAAVVRLAGSAFVALGVLLSGFVISEPAPYELMMAGLVAIWFLLGLRISRAIAPLLALLLTFNVGGLFSLTVMADLADGPIYIAVSLFLALTSVFYAAIVEDDPRRLRLIFQAWLISALLTGTLGILGYFHAFAGSETFTLYDRAKGAFQDPNVFGPFLVAPALYLIHGLLTGTLKRAPLRIAGLLVLSLAVFLSFSRAAWALFLFSACALVLVMLLKERTAAFRLKILGLSLASVILLGAALLAALQSEKVSGLFSSRTQLVQDYDGGHLGRFDRHRIGFEMAMEHPLGIGPLVFGLTFAEDEHNVLLKSLTTYGWLGFVTYIGLISWTLAFGLRYLLRDRPWQPFLMIAWIVLVGHVGIGNVIDTDHWRHFYLLLGIMWGCRGLEHRHLRRSRLGN